MAFLLIGAAVGGFTIVPYSVLSPGEARAGEPLVQIKGHRSYRHQGRLLFVTVNVRDRVSAGEAIYGWLRGDQAVIPSRDVVGTHTPEEDLRSGVIEMRQSKEAAIVLALRHIGVRVPEVDRGALVVDVTNGAPADGKVGIGDTITAIDGKAVHNVGELRLLLAAHKPGDHIALSVRSFVPTTKVEATGGKARTVPLTLASFPAENGEPPDPRKAFVGISPVTDATFTLPFDVNIDTGPVGGPSAGLAFTLTLIDRLSRQGILGKHKVAATGTIDLEGKVGPVGGVPQKTVAVRRSGADLFIVPSSEYRQAKANAGGLRVEKVDTLDEALRILRGLGS